MSRKKVLFSGRTTKRGGVVKTGPPRKKILFPIDNNTYFTLTILRNMLSVGNVVVSISMFVAIFDKNYGCFSLKNLGSIFFVKIRFDEYQARGVGG